MWKQCVHIVAFSVATGSFFCTNVFCWGTVQLVFCSVSVLILYSAETADDYMFVLVSYFKGACNRYNLIYWNDVKWLLKTGTWQFLTTDLMKSIGNFIHNRDYNGNHCKWPTLEWTLKEFQVHFSDKHAAWNEDCSQHSHRNVLFISSLTLNLGSHELRLN